MYPLRQAVRLRQAGDLRPGLLIRRSGRPVRTGLGALLQGLVAKLEVIALISGFATMYGALQATLDQQGVTGSQHAAMHARAFARAAASGLYPNLSAALATAGPAPGENAIFESSVMRLIDAARLAT